MNDVSPQSFLPTVNWALVRSAVLRLLHVVAVSGAALRRWLTGRFVIVGFLIAAFLFSGFLLITQALIIGALDRLGVAPQPAFLALNLSLIAGLAVLSLYPAAKRRREAHVSAATLRHSTASAATVNELSAIGPVCKLLFMQRLITKQKDQGLVLHNLKRGDNNDDIPGQNWLCGS